MPRIAAAMAWQACRVLMMSQVGGIDRVGWIGCRLRPTWTGEVVAAGGATVSICTVDHDSARGAAPL
jgi:hypothetical protein